MLIHLLLLITQRSTNEYNPSLIANAYKHLPEYKREIPYVHDLILKEAGYGLPSRHSQNSRSTAYGLGQFLNSTWKGVGIKKTDDSIKQICAVIIYCNRRYGSVKNAVSAWNKRGRFSRGRYHGGYY